MSGQGTALVQLWVFFLPPRHERDSRATALLSLFVRMCVFLFIWTAKTANQDRVTVVAYSYSTYFLLIRFISKPKKFRPRECNRYRSRLFLFCLDMLKKSGQGSASQARAAILPEQAQGCEGEGEGIHQGGHQGQHRAPGSRRCRPREGSCCCVRQGQAGEKTSHRG